MAYNVLHQAPDDRCFIVSDSPAVLGSRMSPSEYKGEYAGFELPDAQIMLPISSRLMLVLSAKQMVDKKNDDLLRIMMTGVHVVRKQNVSLGIKGLRYNSVPIDVDIVPAKQQNINSNHHSLYKSKQNSWTQTNIKMHIDLVKNSGRREFIKLVKIWRECHHLEFPSINLELSVLDALNRYPHDIFHLKVVWVS